MLAFGLIVGTLNIIFGIWALSNSHGYGFMVFTGIVEIISGLFMFWLSFGAYTAYKSEKRINYLDDEIKKLRVKNDLAFKYLKKLGVSETEIKEELHQHFIDIPKGFMLVTLVSKTFPDSTIIPKGSQLPFYVLKKYADGNVSIVVEIRIKKKTHRIKYKQDELAIPSSEIMNDE